MVGSIPGQGTYKNQPTNVKMNGTTNRCVSLSLGLSLSLYLCLKINKLKKERERKNVNASIASKDCLQVYFPLKGDGEEAQ